MKKSIGETNLSILIAHMQPVLNEGEYIFATITDIDSIPRSVTICEMREAEGVTVVMAKEDADKYGLTYDYVSTWITLDIHSSLDAVGLTAAFSAALGDNDISCNVIAGYYHDHIFVSKKDEEKAMKTLEDLAKSHQRK